MAGDRRHEFSGCRVVGLSVGRLAVCPILVPFQASFVLIDFRITCGLVAKSKMVSIFQCYTPFDFMRQ